MAHEEGLIRAFILPTKRERYLGCLKKPKKRARLCAELAHSKTLNPKFAFRIPPNQQNLASLLSLLTAMGAGPMCWVISEDSETDGPEFVLETVLKETVGRGKGTLVSCIAGKLAYFEDEDGRFILER
jgi:hypothetical protein